LYSLRAFFLKFDADATPLGFLLETFSVHGNCFTSKRVEDTDISLDYSAYGKPEIPHQSFAGFCLYVNCESPTSKAHATFLFLSKNV